MVRKYGREEYLSSSDCKEKTLTWIKQFGNYDTVSQIPEIKEKIKSSILTHYNEKYYVQTDEYKNNIFRTYSVNHISEIPAVREKAKQTMLKRYGVVEFWSIRDVEEWIKNKRKDLSSSLFYFNIHMIHFHQVIRLHLKLNEFFGVCHY